MKTKFKSTIFLVAVTILCLSACSGGYRYQPQTLSPRAYFVEEQVQSIRTTDDIAANKPVYIEFGTREGERASGSLLRITSHDVVYFDKSKQKSAVPGAGARGKAKKISKEKILFLKVW